MQEEVADCELTHKMLKMLCHGQQCDWARWAWNAL